MKQNLCVGSKVLTIWKKVEIIHRKMQMLSRHWHLGGYNFVALRKKIQFIQS